MKKKFYYAVIVLFALLSLLPLLMHTNKSCTDTSFHLANISDLVSAISLENPFPKISLNIGNGMGYSTHLFYGPLPHYLTAYLHMGLMNIGFEVWDTLVFVYVLVAIISGIAIFELSYSVTNNKTVALVSSIIFTLLPYRIGEFCSISAMTQAFTSMFIPMILLSLNRLAENKPFLHLFVIGFVGMILSHLVISLYATIFLLFWPLFNIKKFFAKEVILKLIMGVIIVSIVVLPFISLTLSQKTDANIATLEGTHMWWLEYSHVSPIKLLIPTDPAFGIDVEKFGMESGDYFWSVPEYLNIVAIISFFITLITLIIKRKKDRRIFYYLFLTLLCLVLFSKHFPWKMMPSIFYKVQFQRRFFVYLDIVLSVLAPFWLTFLNPKKQKIFSCLILILLVITTIPLFKSLTKRIDLIERIDYSQGTGWYNDYYPQKSVDNMEHIKNRGLNVRCNYQYLDSAIIYSYADQLIFKIDSIVEENIVELPRFFYAGYELTNSKNEEIEIYENDYGLIEFKGPSDTYYLKFEGTTIYKIFIIIRYIFFIGLILYFILKKKINKHTSQAMQN